MPTTIEAQGRTVDEAIQIALNQLGASRDKVEIEILHHPRRGFLGIGARRAKVRATLRQGIMLDGEEFDMSGGTLQEKPRRRRRRGGKGRTGRGENEQDSATPEREADREKPREADRGRRGSDRPPERAREDRRGRESQTPGRDDRRGRGDQQPPREDARAGGGRADQRDQKEPREQRGREQREQRGREPREQRDRRQQQPGGGQWSGRAAGATSQETQPLRSEPQQPQAMPVITAEREPEPRYNRPASTEPESQVEQTIAPSVETSTAAVIAEPVDPAVIRERAQELVTELIVAMGFTAAITSWVDEVTHEVVVSVRSESEGLLIGRRGQTLDAIEHVVNRAILRGEGTGEGRVLLDIGDYRRRRRETLIELADRLRTRALAEQRTVQVSPMSPRDRKFFQQALAADTLVEVRALGAGFYRRMIVAPAGLGPAALGDAAASEPSFADEDDVGEDAGESFSPGETPPR